MQLTTTVTTLQLSQKSSRPFTNPLMNSGTDYLVGAGFLLSK
jgi:hypothetical protein